MRRPYLVTSVITVAFLLLSAVVASAQSGPLRGTVKLFGADGKPAPVDGAVIDVFRTDIAGEYHTKSDKKGEWVFAGLPYVGTYIVAISAPGAQANAKGGVKAGREIPVDVILAPGNGKRLTLEEAKAAVAGGSSSPGGGSESAADKAKREEMIKKNKELEESNKKNENINKVVGEAFKAGNAALAAKNYDEALKQYDTGLAADPEQPALLTNKALALKARGVDKYNAAIQTKDEAARTSGLESAKADFKAAADAVNKAADLLKKVPAATDPEELKQQTVNKYVTMSARAEAMRLFVTKADSTQADAGIAAFEDYIAVETDPAKKSKAQLDLAQMLLDAGVGDKAFAEFQKILAQRPDDPEANLGAGLALFSTGDKAKYQEAANYLQHFVDKAGDDHKFKADAKAILAELKSTENVVPEKTTPARRKRP
ncbi:MAG TPA: carboxypeptidase regulatory-like domain-containing protein [Pyrinomonadaceae bacterium]|nr:carboxypeptidase regulatory-like domain-containing protein [Pyrinomonadaceae bacterium]